MQTKQNNDNASANFIPDTRTIQAGACTIRVKSITSFWVDDNPAGERDEFYQYGPYYVPDTRDLDSIVAVVSNLKWTEDQLNDAVAALNPEDKSLREREFEYRD